MEFELETHWEMLMILPALAITHGTCEDPVCDLSHCRLTLSWIYWTLHIYF